MKKSADALIAGSLPAATIGTFGSALLKRFLRGASSTCGAGSDEADGGGADSGNGTERSSLLTTVVFLVAFLAILGTASWVAELLCPLEGPQHKVVLVDSGPLAQ